jgi:hypothetical protein
MHSRWPMKASSSWTGEVRVHLWLAQPDLDGTQPHMLRYHREIIDAGKPADDTGYR